MESLLISKFDAVRFKNNEQLFLEILKIENSFFYNSFKYLVEILYYYIIAIYSIN